MGTSSPKCSERLAWVRDGGLFREPRLAQAGIPHGFTSRPLGDMKHAAARRQAAGGDVLVLRQRHTTVVHAATAAWGATGRGTVPTGDGLVSAVPGLRIGVFVTDCQPLYLWDAKGLRAVGVFHAGWRGTADGMGLRAAEALSRLGVEPEDMAAAVGPHIGPCCYRVGAELAPRFRPGSLERRDGELFLELAAELKAQLVEAGVPADAVGVSADCTACGADDFYSYRRAKDSQSMLAFISVPWPA